MPQLPGGGLGQGGWGQGGMVRPPMPGMGGQYGGINPGGMYSGGSQWGGQLQQNPAMMQAMMQLLQQFGGGMR